MLAKTFGIRIVREADLRSFGESSLQQRLDGIERINQVIYDRLAGIETAIGIGVQSRGPCATFEARNPAAHKSAHELQRRILSLAKLLCPKRAIEVKKIRVGGPNDGGYVMLDDFFGIEAAISLGIGPDNSWDSDIAQKGIVVHQFDQTASSIVSDDTKVRFHRFKIVPLPSDGGITLGSILERMIGISKTILKIDIEGDEWVVFESLGSKHLEQFSQIICEFHCFEEVSSDLQFRRMQLVLEKLDASFAVVHLHGNNCSPWRQIGGVMFPSVLEVTYASRDRYRFDDSNEIFPTALDAPNDINKPDYILGPFRWPTS